MWSVIFKFDFAGSIVAKTKFSQLSPCWYVQSFYRFAFNIFNLDFTSFLILFRWIDNIAGKILAVRLRQIYYKVHCRREVNPYQY